MKWQLALFVLSIVIGYSLYDDFNPQQLENKNVVITGGSEGIGEQLAYHYARMGARVLITSRTESKLKKVVEQCRKEGRRNGVYLYHAADMNISDASYQLIKVAEEKLGGIDFLVLNHILPPKPDAWNSIVDNVKILDTTMNINFFSYVRLASAAMNSLRRSHGSIVVVSSVAGRVPQPYVQSYSASKFALDGFFGGLRQEFQIENVDVSITICYIALTNTTNAISNLQAFKEGRIVDKVHIASPQDVAYAIVRGGAKRETFVYYPYSYARVAVVIYNIVPWLIEMFQISMYS